MTATERVHTMPKRLITSFSTSCVKSSPTSPAVRRRKRFRRHIKTLHGEIAKSLTGESIYTSEDLSIALEKIKSKISEDEETLEKLKDEGASLETKKMIACRLFSRFEVGQGVQDQGHNEYDLSAVCQRLGRGTTYS